MFRCVPDAERDFDAAISLDLEFGLNWVLIDAAGVLTLTYDTSLRTEAELATLERWARDTGEV